MSNQYLIRLKPLGNFYFGGERSFREATPTKTKKEEQADDKNEALSYIVESNYFPQQTALLGMLRFLLLRNSGAFKDNKIVNETKATELIGASSFTLNLDPNDFKFGKIEKIGTCFVCKRNENNVLLPMPLDYKLNVNFTDSTTANYCSRNDILLPLITLKSSTERYSAKDGIDESLLLGSEVIDYGYDDKKETGVFIKDRRVGINRDLTTGKVEKNNLYKQEFYRLADDYEFVFIATLADLDDAISYKTYNGQTVELGGDNSKFSITFDDVPAAFKTEYSGIDKCSLFKAVLLSDALIEDTSLSCFSISASTPMRFLQSSVKETKDYNKISTSEKQSLYKSERQSLYKKGSVFYFETELKRDSFIDAVKSKTNFKNIGYNNIQKID